MWDTGNHFPPDGGVVGLELEKIFDHNGGNLF